MINKIPDSPTGSLEYLEKRAKQKIASLLNDTCIIIRSCEERTEKLCYYSIIKSGISENHIFFIKNITPFSKALQVGYLKAIQANKKYTVCVDADQVLLEFGILPLLFAAERSTKKTFFVNSLWFDYLTGYISPGGPHLYRTSYLKEAIKHIPNENLSLRPETYTTKEMIKLGYESLYIDIPITLHGFEQFNKDIFRNVINKYFKSRHQADYLEHRFSKLAKTEEDFKIALLALKHARTTNKKLILDFSQFDEEFKKCNLLEKEAIKDVELKYSELIKFISDNKDDYQLRGYTFDLLNKKSYSKNYLTTALRLWEKIIKM